MERTAMRPRLVRLLQAAFSGELGASLAYAGHAASVADPAERRHIRDIRSEELDHRQRVGRILADLSAQPRRGLEWRYRCIGSCIAAFCHMGGWFLPMYGAGWLERRNIAEYAEAARLALACGADRHVADLLDMAEAEWEHERYFRLKAASHPLARVLPVWQAPAPKAEIRRGLLRTVSLAGEPAPARASMQCLRIRRAGLTGRV